MITFDFSELTEFQKDVTELVNYKYPGKAKKLMNKAGTALKKITKEEYKAKTQKRTGNLLKGITKGKPYKFGNTWQIRVKNKAPHAHLLEYGHRMVNWRTNKVSRRTPYVKGRYIISDAAEAFTPEFNRMCEEFIDELVEDMGKSKLRRMIRGKRR